MKNNLLLNSGIALNGARDMAHKAVQIVTKAARANLEAKPDDSHSNLGWNDKFGAFMSQPMPGGNGDLFVGLDIARLKLIVVQEDRLVSYLELASASDIYAGKWLDDQLALSGLAATSPVSLPYDLPASAAGIKTFSTDGLKDDLRTLSAWFSLADAKLTEFAASQRQLSPGPSQVRCWPHHFDIATYVGLEDGNAESARGIGVGMSPGDESYDQPYFYINPWPLLDASDLPDLPPPGHWHTQGFVGAIATAEKIQSLDNIGLELPAFIMGAFVIGRKKLGA